MSQLTLNNRSKSNKNNSKRHFSFNIRQHQCPIVKKIKEEKLNMEPDTYIHLHLELNLEPLYSCR